MLSLCVDVLYLYGSGLFLIFGVINWVFVGVSVKFLILLLKYLW